MIHFHKKPVIVWVDEGDIMKEYGGVTIINRNGVFQEFPKGSIFISKNITLVDWNHEKSDDR